MLIIDIRYETPDGRGRFRRDAEVQTMSAARAEDRRRELLLATTGRPFERDDNASEVAVTVPVFEDLAREYLKTFAVTQLKPSTRFGYRAVIEQELIPMLGTRRVDCIDVTAARDLDAKLVARKVKPSTRRNVQVVLRSILCRYAVEVGALKVAPSLLKLPKVGRTVLVAMTSAEVERILSVAKSAARRAFMLAAYAGLRSGEVQALRWRDVDLDRGQLVVRVARSRGETAAPKSGHERVVPLLPALREELERTPATARVGLVARNAEGGMWNEYTLRKALARATKRAKLRRWRFHDLRHYFVTALFRAGNPAPVVQMLAGHADLSVTQRYAHVDANDLRLAMERLAGQQRGNSLPATIPNQS